MTDKDSYRPDEVAKALCVSIWTIYRRLNNGEIAHIHIGKSHRSARIPKEEFARIMKTKA